MSDDDVQELIARPPSHPIATTLLFCSIVGTCLAIFFVHQELFVEYLPTPAPGKKNDSKKIAQKHTHDHYGQDFKGKGELLAEVEAELGVSKVVGDLNAKKAGGAAPEKGGGEG